MVKTLDIFRLGAPHLDTISPDIYLQDAPVWKRLNTAYADGIHPYYIPELLPGPLSITRSIEAVVKNGLCGVHYFGIDMMVTPEGTFRERFAEAAEAMGTLAAMKPMIEKYQGTHHLYAVTQYEGMSEQFIDFGDYIGSIRFDDKSGDLLAKNTDRTMDNLHIINPDQLQRGKGLIVYEGSGTFYLAGNAYRLMLFPKKKIEWAVSAAHSADFLNQDVSRSFLWMKAFWMKMVPLYPIESVTEMRLTMDSGSHRMLGLSEFAWIRHCNTLAIFHR